MLRCLAAPRSGRLLAVAALTLVAAASLTGCSGSPGVTVPTAGTTDIPTSPPSSGSQSPPASLSPPSATSSGAPSSSGVPLCRTSDLAVSVGRVDAGAGQRYVPVVFRNTSTRPCALKGYPGVAGLDAAGAQVVQARRQGGLTPVRVTVAPGASASAVVHAGAVPSGSGTCPPDYVALLVTPPDETRSVRVVVTLPACAGLTVRPVVAGS